MCSFNCWPVGHRDVNEISGFKGFTAILMVQICGNVLPVVFVWTEAGPLSWRGKCAACAQYGGPTGRCPGCDVVNSLPRRQASVFHQDTERFNKYICLQMCVEEILYVTTLSLQQEYLCPKQFEKIHLHIRDKFSDEQGFLKDANKRLFKNHNK